MRWSQWVVVGTWTSSRPAVMNCNHAIWAVASCMATRSGRRSTYDTPRSRAASSGSSRWLTRIFSARVSGPPMRRRPPSRCSSRVAYTPWISSIGVEAATVIVDLFVLFGRRDSGIRGTQGRRWPRFSQYFENYWTHLAQGLGERSKKVKGSSWDAEVWAFGLRVPAIGGVSCRFLDSGHRAPRRGARPRWPVR